jgi:hypothetical protein
MHADFVLIPDDEPGMLARLGEACGAAGINIEGISAFTGQGKGVVHVLVPDAEHALSVLREAGLDVRAARQVIVVDPGDAPGSLGMVARRLADAGVNIEQAYTASENRLVFAVDDHDAATQALQET